MCVSLVAWQIDRYFCCVYVEGKITEVGAIVDERVYAIEGDLPMGCEMLMWTRAATQIYVLEQGQR